MISEELNKLEEELAFRATVARANKQGITESLHKRSLETIQELRKALGRAAFTSEHLFQMISREEWRATGGDDGQGHYEGEYYADKVYEEIKQLRETAGPDKDDND